MRALMTLTALASLTGCSQVSGDEKLCRDDIKSKLINPETVEFHDFSQIPPAVAENMLYEIMLKGRTASKPEAASDPVIQEAFRERAHQTTLQVQDLKDEFYSVRVRAEGRLGNKITSENLCHAGAGVCECVSEESVRS